MQQRRTYSRLAKVEEQRNKRTALRYLILTILFLVFVGVFGIRLLTNLAGLLANVNSTGISDPNDTTPPAPPMISTMPEATKEMTLPLSGSAETGAVVTLFINNEKKELISDASGQFSTTINLRDGENEIYAKATDGAGNESANSTRYLVIHDDESPKVEIIKPKDGDKFFGSRQKQQTIEGSTEADARVTINDRVVIIDHSGNFRHPVTLSVGENSFNIKSTDKAGNQTELTIYLAYSE